VHVTGDGAILSSGEQDTLQDNISSGADVDLTTSERKTDSEGIKDPSIGINVEEIQGPYDTSNKDHFTDPPATTPVIAESDKDTCDAEVVCAGKLESSGADAVGMIVVQEAPAVADHDRARGIGECRFPPLFNVDTDHLSQLLTLHMFFQVLRLMVQNKQRWLQLQKQHLAWL